MSCVSCEDVEKKGDIAYVRIDRANVGMIGCDEHINKVLINLGFRDSEGVVFRIKKRRARKSTIKPRD